MPLGSALALAFHLCRLASPSPSACAYDGTPSAWYLRLPLAFTFAVAFAFAFAFPAPLRPDLCLRLVAFAFELLPLAFAYVVSCLGRRALPSCLAPSPLPLPTPLPTPLPMPLPTPTLRLCLGLGLGVPASASEDLPLPPGRSLRVLRHQAAGGRRILQ